MKKTLIIPFLLSMLATTAQQPIQVNQPFIFNKWISVGKYTTAGMPAASACPRCILYNTDSSNFAFSNSSRWVYLGTSPGSAVTVNWGQIAGNIAAQNDLINRLNLKINVADTSGMLGPYLRAALGVKYGDTTAMLSPYLLSVLGIKYADSGAMLAPYLRSVNFTKAGIALGNVINFKQVVNKGGMDSMQVVATFASIPAAGSGPTLVYAADSNALYYNDRTAYHKISGGTGGGGGAFYDSTLMLSQTQAKNTYLRIDSFSAPGISRILGFAPYSSTNPSGFISGNQTINLTVRGDMAGTASGSTVLNDSVTLNRYKGATLPPLGVGALYYNGTSFAFNNGFLPYNFFTAQVLNANGSSLNLTNGIFQVINAHRISSMSGGSIGLTDSTAGIGAFIAISPIKGVQLYYQNKGIVLSNDSLTFWSDSTMPFSFTRAGNASFPGHLTGITENLGDSSNDMASTAFGYRNFLPLLWNKDQTITGNQHKFILSNVPSISQSDPVLHKSALYTPGGILGLDTTRTQTISISGASGTGLDIGFYKSLSPNFAKRQLSFFQDTIAFFADTTTKMLFTRAGSAIFPGHVTGVTESTSDSSKNFVTTQLLKQSLSAFVPGGFQTLTFGSGLLAGSYNGTAAQTLKVDSGTYATRSFLGSTYLPIGGDSAISPGLMFSRSNSGKVITLGLDTAAASAYYLRRKDSTLYVTQTQLNNKVPNIRIAALDSLARVANGLQIVNGSIVPQTANGSFTGFMPSAHFLEVDSIIRRLLVNNVKLLHPGVGKYSGYSSLIGDSLYLKNVDVTGDLTLTSRSDSSLLWGINFNTIAGLTNIQTLSNKTLIGPVFSGYSTSGDTTAFKPFGLDGSGGIARMSFWPGSGGGGGSQNLSQVLTAISDSIKISGGTGFIMPSSTSSLAGLMSAARTRRVDSTVFVGWTGKGKRLIRSPYTKDSLLFSGLGITASGGLGVTYTGPANLDSLSWNLAITALTTNGDLLGYNNGVTRIPMTGTDGMVLTRVSGLPVWQAVSGTGTVTIFSTPGEGLAPFFSTSVANASSTPQLTFSLTPAAAHTFWGNFTGSPGASSYSSPTLASADFFGQGSTVQVLHGGGPSGSPSWGPVDLPTQATGLLPATLFPALQGMVQNTAGTLNTVIQPGVVTNAMLAGAIDLATKVIGIGSPANGFTGVNNGSKTITLGGNFATTGAFPLSFTLAGSTSLILPQSGTLLTANGSGSALSGIVTTATGTPNEIIVNSSTGAVTFSTPQAIGSGSAPTFAGMTFTGLGTGAGTDNVLTIAGNVVRSTPASSILATANVQAGLWNPLLISVNNIPSASITLNSACFYQRVGNIVHGSMTIQINPQPGNGQDFSIAVNVPVASAYSGSFNLHGVIVQAGSIPGDPAGYVVGDSNSGALMLRAFLHSSVNGGNGNGLYIEFTYIVQ